MENSVHYSALHYLNKIKIPEIRKIQIRATHSWWNANWARRRTNYARTQRIFVLSNTHIDARAQLKNAGPMGNNENSLILFKYTSALDFAGINWKRMDITRESEEHGTSKAKVPALTQKINMVQFADAIYRNLPEIHRKSMSRIS